MMFGSTAREPQDVRQLLLRVMHGWVDVITVSSLAHARLVGQGGGALAAAQCAVEPRHVKQRHPAAACSGTRVSPPSIATVPLTPLERARNDAIGFVDGARELHERQAPSGVAHRRCGEPDDADEPSPCLGEKRGNLWRLFFLHALPCDAARRVCNVVEASVDEDHVARAHEPAANGLLAEKYSPQRCIVHPLLPQKMSSVPSAGARLPQVQGP